MKHLPNSRYNTFIVTDLLFGDGGKGLAVANIVKNYSWCNNLVVRFSGGPNAGHTVIDEGRKHIFSSYCSGALNGADSYFTEDTTMYLPNIFREKECLDQLGGKVNTNLYIHPLCNVITPYDIAFHRIIMKEVGHSSTGIGHGRAMHRNLTSPYKLYAIDFLHKDIFMLKMNNIKEWYEGKMGSLTIVPKFREIANYYLKDWEKWFNEPLPFRIVDFYDVLSNKDYTNIIYENAQGILLDMDHGFFPDVTYSNTTSKNAIKYINKYESDSIKCFYVTRCYQTRHGKGMMTNERFIALINTEYEINKDNQFQGEFRLGEIDYDLIEHAKRIDDIYVKDLKYPNQLEKYIIMGCMDQRPGIKIEEHKIDSGISKIFYNNTPSTNAKLLKDL